MNLSKYLYTVTIFIFLFEIYVLLKIVTITTAPILAGSVRNFKILALFKPLFSSQLFLRFAYRCRTRVFSFAVAFK